MTFTFLNWQTIDTHPKEGRTLLWYPCYKFPQIGWWNYADEQFEHVCYFKDDREHYIAPTHWMPLPEAPEAA